MGVMRQGKLRGEHLLFDDGAEVISIWYPVDEEDDDVALIAFDVPLTDVEDAIKLLTRLAEATPEKANEEAEVRRVWYDDEEDAE